MSQFVKNIFCIPLLIAETDNMAICSQAETLAQKFRANAKEATLVSDKWNYSIKSSDPTEIDKYGVTSFNTPDQLDEDEWRPVADFIYDFANTLVKSVYDGPKKLFILNLWTTVYPPGAYVTEHVHSNSLLSGVFYVKKNPGPGGDLILHDPAWVAKTVDLPSIHEFPALPTTYIQPVKTGMMVIFPSWLPHLTQPNDDDEDRIIISFNMQLSNDNTQRPNT